MSSSDSNGSSETTDVNTKRKIENTGMSWPVDSRTALPILRNNNNSNAGGIQSARRFPVTQECTALRLSPTGRLMMAGFTDGTVRLFDLTGTYHPNNANSGGGNKNNNKLQQQQYSGKHGGMVDSKDHQRFGAVAAQICAKGVHTSLLMDVDVSQDGLWCFAGVLRGSMELVAVHLGDVEASFEQLTEQNTNINNNNMLDLVTVHRHQDAKLRGFGACTRLQHSARPEYLLFTGKAIKNMHIWKFVPPTNNSSSDPSAGAAATWTQLYNTTTNGSTITFLQFRHDPQGRLQGISKSDGQKLRVWDLRREDRPPLAHNKKKKNKPRPSKPAYLDVAHTEATLGVAGGQCLCGGPTFYHQLSIVQLDVDRPQLQSGFNHTELALPGSSSSTLSSAVTSSSRRRTQRGDLQCVSRVAGLVAGSEPVLLELSDGRVLQYRSHNSSSSQPASLSETPNEGLLPTLQPLIIPDDANANIDDPAVVRRWYVGRVGARGQAVAVMSTYLHTTGWGCLHLVPLDDGTASSASPSRPKKGFWGFLDLPPYNDPNRWLKTPEELSMLASENNKTVLALQGASRDAEPTEKKRCASPSMIDVSNLIGIPKPEVSTVESTAEVESTEHRSPKRHKKAALEQNCSGPAGKPSKADAVMTKRITPCKIPQPATIADPGATTTVQTPSLPPGTAVVTQSRRKNANGPNIGSSAKIQKKGSAAKAAPLRGTTPRQPSIKSTHQNRLVAETGYPEYKTPLARVMQTPQASSSRTSSTKATSTVSRRLVHRFHEEEFTNVKENGLTANTESRSISTTLEDMCPPHGESMSPINTKKVARRELIGPEESPEVATKKGTGGITRPIVAKPLTPSVAGNERTGSRDPSIEMRTVLQTSRGPGRPKREDPALHPLIKEHCIHMQTKLWMEISKLTHNNVDGVKDNCGEHVPNQHQLWRRDVLAHQTQLASRILQSALRFLESVAEEPSVAAWNSAKLAVNQAVTEFRAMEEDQRHHLLLSDERHWQRSPEWPDDLEATLSQAYGVATNCFADMPCIR